MSTALIKVETDYGVFEKDGKTFTGSQKVAELFKKDHKHVLEDIRKLDCSEDFNRSNFRPITYKDDRGRKQPAYDMTRDGFVFLVMGYNGKKAARIKEAYILSFNYMEDLIRERLIGINDTRYLTEAIKDAHDPCNPHHYSNEFDMMNRIVIGMTAKQFKEQHNVPGNSIRPYLSAIEAYAINCLQRWNTDLIEMGYDYQARKEKLIKIKEKIFAKPPKALTAPTKLLTSKTA